MTFATIGLRFIETALTTREACRQFADYLIQCGYSLVFARQDRIQTRLNHTGGFARDDGERSFLSN